MKVTKLFDANENRNFSYPFEGEIKKITFEIYNRRQQLVKEFNGTSNETDHKTISLKINNFELIKDLKSVKADNYIVLDEAILINQNTQFEIIIDEGTSDDALDESVLMTIDYTEL